VSEFHFSAGERRSSDVSTEFADGMHTIPAWMVAHLGGTDAVVSPDSRAKFRSVTFEQMVRAFHARVAGETLRGVQGQIVRDHMRNIQRL